MKFSSGPPEDANEGEIWIDTSVDPEGDTIDIQKQTQNMMTNDNQTDDMSQRCPYCGDVYSQKISLSSRLGKTIDVSGAVKICQTARRRSGHSLAMKPTREDTEKYEFIGFVHGQEEK